MLGIDEQLTREQWQQVILETKHGGCGVTSSAKTAPAAFVGSVARCMRNLRRIIQFFELRGVELEDLENSQTLLVQQFRYAYDLVKEKLRAAEVELTELAELVEECNTSCRRS